MKMVSGRKQTHLNTLLTEEYIW